jgi:hypothetical protein
MSANISHRIRKMQIKCFVLSLMHERNAGKHITFHQAYILQKT